jgi:hypothetical protein
VIELREDQTNAHDSMRLNSDPASDEILEGNEQRAQDEEQKI